MAALSILYAVDSGVCSSTAPRELIHAFPWQRTTMLRCTYTAMLFSYDAVCVDVHRLTTLRRNVIA